MATGTKRQAGRHLKGSSSGSSRPKFRPDSNLPTNARDQIRKAATDADSLSPIDRKILAEDEARYKKELEAQELANAEALDHLANLESDLERTDTDLNANPADDFSDELLGFDNPNSAAQQAEHSPTAGFRPTIGRPDRTPDSSSNYNKPGSTKPGQSTDGNSSSASEKGEAAKLSSFINQSKTEQDSNLKSKLESAKNSKTSRFSVKGRAKNRVKVILLSLVVTAFTAVPIGIIGVIPHGIQSWIANRTSAFVERNSEKMGAKIIAIYLRDSVGVEKCKKYYNLQGNVAGLNKCRPRLDTKDGRISQIINDYRAADMERRLADIGINLEYDPVESPGKPYKITVDGTDGKDGNFRLPEGFGAAEIDNAEWTGKRVTSKRLGPIIKEANREISRWHPFLKRRNLKAGFMRDLGLPGRFHGPETLARKLDELELKKGIRRSARHTWFRQNLTKHVVKIGDGRVGLLLEILLDNNRSKADPKEVLKYNKVLRAAANKLGEAQVLEILQKFYDKTAKQIAKQLLVDLIGRIFNAAAARAASAALDAIPVIGWILLIFSILDMIDMLSDGTIQKYLSVQNAQAMADVANLMDTSISEERRGFVDIDSAADFRISLIKGLSASRVFTNTIGYNSPTGKKAEGYACKPDVKLTDVESILGALQGATEDNGIDDLKKKGMGKNEDACENHRVDYDPLRALDGLFAVSQAGLDVYTERCIADFGFAPAAIADLILPGELCGYTLQDLYHDINRLLSKFTGLFGPILDILMSIPLVQGITNKFMGFFLNMISIFISGYSLTGPELLQGGLKTDTKSGAKLFDAWEGGQQVLQNNFAKGVGDGGGLGSMPLSPQVAQEMNTKIAQERREELASASIFDRWFDISEPDTLASSVMNVAVIEGSVNSLVNPLNNIASIFNASSTTTYALSDGSKRPYCGETNRHGEAATEFGVVCYGYPDETIDGMSEEDMVKYSDPEYCEKFNIAWDKVISDHEKEKYYETTSQDPDGSGQPDGYNPCRLMCSVTDYMATNFRKNDKICGFEKFGVGGSSRNPNNPSNPGGPDDNPNDPPPPPNPDELGKCVDAPLLRPNEGKNNDIYIVVVPGTSIKVLASLCDSVLSMVQAAAADGVTLNGGGFRTYDEQVQLRKDHCGTSYNAIYEVSANSCRPPTAKPGTSMHESGQAIDFRNCNSRGSACFIWLSNNAAGFGFKNLPSEPWHWSTSGR